MSWATLDKRVPFAIRSDADHVRQHGYRPDGGSRSIPSQPRGPTGWTARYGDDLASALIRTRRLNTYLRQQVRLFGRHGRRSPRATTFDDRESA
jgi:hypothetical protein